MKDTLDQVLKRQPEEPQPTPAPMAEQTEEKENQEPLYHVLLYYQYVTLTESELNDVEERQWMWCKQYNLLGRIRVSPEGLNGTLSGSTRSDIMNYIHHMQASIAACHETDWKHSRSTRRPFQDLIIRRVSEVVSIGLPTSVCAVEQSATHVDPETFHALLQNQDRNSVLVDVRNNYEYEVGHFQNALNPKTRRFGQFPEWCDSNAQTLKSADKILMYCTGGVRCEKASAYVKHLITSDDSPKQAPEIVQLRGGIHRYLERFPDGGGYFRGKNFVFDERQTTDTSPGQEIVGQCQSCERPYDQYAGIRCHYCRSHVMVCPECLENVLVKKNSNREFYCNDHHPASGPSLVKLQAQAQDLTDKLATASAHGRTQKNKRRSIRKQLVQLRQQIQVKSDYDVDAEISCDHHSGPEEMRSIVQSIEKSLRVVQE